jgi:hypothetical protein
MQAILYNGDVRVVRNGATVFFLSSKSYDLHCCSVSWEIPEGEYRITLQHSLSRSENGGIGQIFFFPVTK